jgi:hypothetical protein
VARRRAAARRRSSAACASATAKASWELIGWGWDGSRRAGTRDASDGASGLLRNVVRRAPPEPARTYRWSTGGVPPDLTDKERTLFRAASDLTTCARRHIDIESDKYRSRYATTRGRPLDCAG